MFGTLKGKIHIFVDPEFLVSVKESVLLYTEQGERYSIIGTTDHPSFAKTRHWLGGQGYIEIQPNWINGDRVLKPFYFNNVLMEKGQQFGCAAAMQYSYSDKYNDGKPL